MFKKLVNNIYRQIKSLWSALQKAWRGLRLRRRGAPVAIRPAVRSAMTNEQQPREPVPDNDNSSSQGEQEQIHSYFVGNTNCLYNAHSRYIRCAVNPYGPCEDCPHYQPKE